MRGAKQSMLTVQVAGARGLRVALVRLALHACARRVGGKVDAQPCRGTWQAAPGASPRLAPPPDPPTNTLLSQRFSVLTWAQKVVSELQVSLESWHPSMHQGSPFCEAVEKAGGRRGQRQAER